MRQCLVLMLCVACGPISTVNEPDSGAPRDAGRTDSGVAHDAAVEVVDAGAEPFDAGSTPFDAGVPDAGDGLPDPVLFIHGINGSADDFKVMMERMVDGGWPANRLMARTFGDPKWGCNVNNANTVKQWADELMASTHTTRIDLVAHSMGTLSSRRYMKALGGAAVVNTYVILGGMNHGLSSNGVCLSPGNVVCVWSELCESKPYIADLNAPPATPGPAIWVTIAGTADDTVPNASTFLVGAENIVVPNVTHSGATGLQEDLTVYADVVRVLRYPGH